jgi:radical SAM protein with 4Fe4S-binding SPASM domain
LEKIMAYTDAENSVCKQHCIYFKPERKEDERCRGYHVASLIFQELPFPDNANLTGNFDSSFLKSFLHRHVCSDCSFLVDGCDFTSPDPPLDCLPCGGMVFLSKLLERAVLNQHDIRVADFMLRGDKASPCLTPRCTIKRLEEDYVYHIPKDELYEVNDDALKFLISCDGTRAWGELEPDPEFLEYCLAEDILEHGQSPVPIELFEVKSPIPSLRYLEWLVTLRCNLKCRHCYLGDPKTLDFPERLIKPLLEQFSRMQGLRIMVSGGEPLLYKHFEMLNNLLPNYPIRAILLTNGLLLDNALLSTLNFHEIQVSLDGMEHGHEFIRGAGTFSKTVEIMEQIRNAGMDLSVATMVHCENLDEWDEMEALVRGLGAREWNIDYPCVSGRWGDHPELAVDLSEAAQRMRYGFGGSYHGSSPGWTCGRHLVAVLPSGEVCRCGLFQKKVFGSIDEGLVDAWNRVERIPMNKTECTDCPSAESCGGGCRFRAGGPSNRDPVMCKLHEQS